MATAKLRKAFRYRGEENESDVPEDMDEEGRNPIDGNGAISTAKLV